MDSVKYYNIEIRGRVQDIGFRNFFKAPTDELGDISRKLDIGVGFLHSIDTKLDKLDSLDTKVDVVVELLRKIAEK